MRWRQQCAVRDAYVSMWRGNMRSCV